MAVQLASWSGTPSTMAEVPHLPRELAPNYETAEVAPGSTASAGRKLIGSLEMPTDSEPIIVWVMVVGAIAGLGLIAYAFKGAKV